MHKHLQTTIMSYGKAAKQKQTVTCLRSAHLELQQKGVPVYRVLPAKPATGVSYSI